MKVFKIIPHKEYCHGCVIVAANSKEEAMKLYCQKDEFNKFMVEEANCECKEIEGMFYAGKDIVIIDTLFIE